ncbi:hypothetical protein [Cellulomonas sp. IC4_254]|uniref:hypothetical protein n=1 Tax=Cellulomonas sp. IC4_254 TaxID=2714040 RepID=UPI00141F862A|nr:hypothetical protein [Cellulomonas sp. IC4_254]NHT16934.1 hypothetical protein [Cellulomonas sp. IC4_254]
MSDATPLPAAMEVREHWEGLVGRDITVTTGGPMVDPVLNGGALVGVYVDKLMKLSALVLFDLPLAAHLGASIALVPARTAQTAVEEEQLPSALAENAGEILNVTAALFNVGDAPHLKLDRWYAPREPLPADVAQWVLAYVRRLDLEVEVSGYGSGTASVLVI